mmetsp:Transcript_66300/g.185387  ORF Transcript_66300/g.185387 Transcript_66300/m.185387 type:complete len:232 (+) Transcript_66300:656-1351(+)
MPAIWVISLSVHSVSILQTTMKVSPPFLFGDPQYWCATPWTISAIWFTNVMILDCSTSVAVLKSRMRMTPMMQSTLVPGIIASTPALSPPRMLWPMMFAPASPKPSANKDPNLMIVFSNITVSKGPLVSALHICPVHTWLARCRSTSFLALARRARATSSFLNSSSAIRIAFKGLSRISSTRSIILSTGWTMRRFASLAKTREATMRRMSTVPVLSILNIASALTKGRKSK